MTRANINGNRSFFSVLQTGERAQTAMMTLRPGTVSGEAGMNDHPDCEQVLLVLEGRLEAEIAGEHATLEAGDVVIVPRNAPHHFRNTGDVPAVTFNVYGPPAY